MTDSESVRSAAPSRQKVSLSNQLKAAARKAEKRLESLSEGARRSGEKEQENWLDVANKANDDQRRRHREVLTPQLQIVAQGWMIFVAVVLIWQGFGSRIGFFNLSDKVLITLLTTTTINVLGLFLVALSYLYGPMTSLKRKRKTSSAKAGKKKSKDDKPKVRDSA